MEFAKTKDELLAPEEKHTKKQKAAKSEETAKTSDEPQAKKKFEEYKDLIQKGSKQSWNDLLVGEDAVVEEPKKKKAKQEVKQEKIAAKK